MSKKYCKNLSELSARKGLKNNLFTNFTAKSLDKQQLAKDFLIAKGTITGAMSFYDFLKDDNKGKKVYICNGSACLCAGTQDEVRTNLLHHFQTNEIGHMTCLGRCHENSAFHYAGKNYSALTARQIDEVVANKTTITDNYNTANIGKRILTNQAMTLAEYLISYKKVLKQDKQAIILELKTSQLRGRGGAGFPIAYKLAAAASENSADKYIICNADEGDAGAYSDRYLLEQQPYLVLFGIMVAAYVVGANYGVLYIRAEYPEAVTIMQAAITELSQHELLAGFNFKIIVAQGAYICGEETALINSIEGQRSEVRTRPPFPTQQGLFNQPTVVNNVETLASIYNIVTHGGAAYAQLGTEKSTGTKLVSLDSAFQTPGIYEVEMGTPLKQVFAELGGGLQRDIKALQIGGPLGGIVPIAKVPELSIDFESFSQQGFLLGHASVVSIPQDFSMIKYLQHLFAFAAYESCGKCFPCRLGTKRGEELLTNAIKHGTKIDRVLFADLLDTLQQGSLCAHGGGLPLPVKNVLKYFADELGELFEENKGEF